MSMPVSDVLSLLPGLLAAGDCLLLALPDTGIGLRALPVNGQPAAMADALVAADLDLAADVGLHLAAQVALYLVGGLDPVPQADELIVAERVHAGIPADAGRLQRLERTSPADSVDIGQGDLKALVAREVDADETCHPGSSPSLAEVLRAAPGPCPDRAPASSGGDPRPALGPAADRGAWLRA